MSKSIMPESDLYSTERQLYLEEHHIFFGRGRRQLSDKYGLVVYLTNQDHYRLHNQDHNFDLELKKIGQQAAMDYYGWDIEQFRAIFGKNYLD